METKDVQQVLKAEYPISSRGRLSNEDLTQIVEHRPWIFEAIAHQMVITKSEVRDYVSSGKVSSDDYFTAVTSYKLKHIFNWPKSFTGQLLEW